MSFLSYSQSFDTLKTVGGVGRKEVSPLCRQSLPAALAKLGHKGPWPSSTQSSVLYLALSDVCLFFSDFYPE